MSEQFWRNETVIRRLASCTSSSLAPYLRWLNSLCVQATWVLPLEVTNWPVRPKLRETAVQVSANWCVFDRGRIAIHIADGVNSAIHGIRWWRDSRGLTYLRLNELGKDVALWRWMLNHDSLISTHSQTSLKLKTSHVVEYSQRFIPIKIYQDWPQNT